MKRGWKEFCVRQGYTHQDSYIPLLVMRNTFHSQPIKLPKPWLNLAPQPGFYCCKRCGHEAAVTMMLLKQRSQCSFVNASIIVKRGGALRKSSPHSPWFLHFTHCYEQYLSEQNGQVTQTTLHNRIHARTLFRPHFIWATSQDRTQSDHTCIIFHLHGAR